jgi:hypothetical protein
MVRETGVSVVSGGMLDKVPRAEFAQRGLAGSVGKDVYVIKDPVVTFPYYRPAREDS